MKQQGPAARSPCCEGTRKRFISTHYCSQLWLTCLLGHSYCQQQHLKRVCALLLWERSAWHKSVHKALTRAHGIVVRISALHAEAPGSIPSY
eukprot:3202163-Amphidinium_carterae.3